MGENCINFLPNTETPLIFIFFSLFSGSSGAIPKGNLLFAKGLQLQAREECRGGKSTANSSSRISSAQRNATEPKCPTLWEPFSSQGFNPSPWAAVWAGMPQPEQGAPGAAPWAFPPQGIVSVQWENLSTPGNQWRLCLSGFYIHFCHRPPASHYLSLISHCRFGTILSPLPVMFVFSGFLEFCLLLCSVHCWGTVGITAPLIEGQTPQSTGCEDEV